MSCVPPMFRSTVIKVCHLHPQFFALCSLFLPPILNPLPQVSPLLKAIVPLMDHRGNQGQFQGGGQETHHRGQARPLSSVLTLTPTPVLPLGEVMEDHAQRPKTAAGEYTTLGRRNAFRAVVRMG